MHCPTWTFTLSPKPGPPVPVGSWQNQAVCGWDCVCGQPSGVLGCEGGVCVTMPWARPADPRRGQLAHFSSPRSSWRHPVNTTSESTGEPLDAGSLGGAGRGHRHSGRWPFAAVPEPQGLGREGGPGTSRSGETSSKGPCPRVSPDTRSLGCEALARTVPQAF